MNVISGSLLENVTNTIRNTTVVDITSFQLDGNASSADTSDQYAVYISSSHSIPYQVSMGAKLALTGWFSTLFRVGSATRNSFSFNRSISSTDADAIAVNLTVGISSGDTFFDTDIVTAFYWNYYQYSQGIPLLLSDLATSMTVAFRSFTGAVVVSGAAETTESYVCVRWSFLTPPLVVVVGAGLFLGCVMWRTKVTGCQQWKGSVLAVLRCGLDSKIRKSFEETEDLNRMRSVAKGVKVKLNADDEGIWLRE
ncbi:MAG: hypothetical protein M1822_005515 [Bathelium mastoideum]|nr:MAG: hypothetical protein M1822_005515 [Bathelium mastoideum]